MPIVPVIVESWQQECCGKPFAIGDEVEWSLVNSDETDPAFPEGTMFEEHHDPIEKGTLTRGTVRRIRLITQTFEQFAEREYKPIPGEVALRDLERVPSVFQSGLASPPHQSETGVLVDLEVGAPGA